MISKILLALLISTVMPLGAKATESDAARTEIHKAVLDGQRESLRAVGLKYKDSDDLDISGAAHAALIKAEDVTDLPNILTRFRLSLESGSRDAERFSSLVSLYIQSAHLPFIHAALSNELVTLEGKQPDLYSRVLIQMLIASSSDLVSKTFLHRETESLLGALTTESDFALKRDRIGSLLHALSIRGDPLFLDAVSRLRRIAGKDVEDLCKRYEWKYRVVTAEHPEDVLRDAMRSGDKSLERWCIVFIHGKRLASMLPYLEERVKVSSSVIRDYYIQAIRELRNPDKIKAPLGSFDNPVILSGELLDKQKGVSPGGNQRGQSYK